MGCQNFIHQDHIPGQKQEKMWKGRKENVKENAGEDLLCHYGELCGITAKSR